MSFDHDSPRTLRVPLALSLGTVCAAWALWTPAGPDGSASERPAVSQPAGPTALASVHGHRDGSAAMDAPVTAPAPGSRTAGRALLAKRLASERTGHAARQGLLARRPIRPIPPRGLASGSALRVQLERAFDDEIERLTARAAAAVDAAPGNS